MGNGLPTVPESDTSRLHVMTLQKMQELISTIVTNDDEITIESVGKVTLILIKALAQENEELKARLTKVESHGR